MYRLLPSAGWEKVAEGRMRALCQGLLPVQDFFGNLPFASLTEQFIFSWPRHTAQRFAARRPVRHTHQARQWHLAQVPPPALSLPQHP